MYRTKPDQVIEVFLRPGEFHFGGQDKRIRTVLGSCVSLVFWHPQRKIGGMCHYLLPHRNPGGKDGELDGRYADEAFALILREMRRTHTEAKDYQVKLFGGGNMFPGREHAVVAHVGRKNVEAARRLIKQHHLNCVGEHLEGIGHRNVIFDVWSGDVWIKHQEPLALSVLPGEGGDRA